MNKIRAKRATTAIIVNIENKNKIIKKTSVGSKRFIKEYLVLSQYYATFLNH